MPGKIFVNYRRDDVPGDARGVRDGLAAKFGKASVFMDVDNLLVGQRFAAELAKALDACDVLIAIIGPRWMDLLRDRTASGERDYVREEIAAALARRITVIPVRVGREGSMPALPRQDDLPEDIRDLVDFQKHDVAHERFGRDIAELIEGIFAVRKALAAGERPGRRGAVPWGWVGAGAMGVLAIGYVIAAQIGVPVPWPTGAATRATDDASRAADAARVKAAADRLAEAEAKLAAEQKARADAEARAKQLADAADKTRRDQEAREKAARDEAAGNKVEDEARVRAAEAEAKRKSDEAEFQRLAARKAEDDRKHEAAAAMQPGRVFRDCPDVCPELVVVAAGSFTMGSNDGASDEKPTRTVTIGRAFAVGKFEVTFAEWEACAAGGGCGSNRSPRDEGWGKGQRPVINVTWNDAREYVAWLSRKTGKTYRLLNEAEWEYAARAGSATRYSWGDTESELCSFANGADLTTKRKYPSWTVASCRDAYLNTAPVGSFKPNAFGLYDMHGNVLEWCEDTWHANYQGAPNDGSAWTIGGTSSRVTRGGSFFTVPDRLRSASRSYYSPGNRLDGIGFRVARTL